MQIGLSARAQQLIEELVASGRASSPEEAIELGLRALEQEDRETAAFFEDRDEAWWADLRAKIQEGLDDIAAGRVREVGPGLFDELRARARQSEQARRHTA